MATILRVYDHRNQVWLTGKEALPMMISRAKAMLKSMTEYPDRYCKATRTPKKDLGMAIARVQRDLDTLTKLL